MRVFADAQAHSPPQLRPAAAAGGVYPVSLRIRQPPGRRWVDGVGVGDNGEVPKVAEQGMCPSRSQQEERQGNRAGSQNSPAPEEASDEDTAASSEIIQP